MNKISIYILAGILILSVVLTGCTTSRPANFYLLTPLADISDNKLERNGMIGVGPIHLAKHLQRKQIVSYTSNNKIQIEEFDRWAGELDDNICYVIAENLGALVDAKAVLTYPWSDTISLDHQIEINIHFFSLDEHNNLKLIAAWNISDTKNDKLVYITRSEIVIAVKGNTINDQINAQNQALLELSQTIAVQFNKKFRK